MLKRIFIALTLTVISLTGSIQAQNNTNSPYTRYGYGELVDNTSIRNKGMGGVGIAMNSKSSINPMNPASYSAVDSLTFMYEFGASAKESIFSNGESTLHKFNGNLDYITILFPIYKKYLAFSGGLVPFSNVGYNFQTEESIPLYLNDTTASIPYTKNFNGSGTLTEAYGGFSSNITKNLAIGVNLKYLFGNIEHVRELSGATVNGVTSNITTTSQTSILNVKDFQIRYGMQYFGAINDKNFYSLGAIFEKKSQVGGDYEIQTTGSDTITKSNGSDFEMPLTIGVGGSYNFNHRLTVAGDVLFQNWADAKYFGKTDSLKNRYKYSLGAELSPSRLARNYFKRITYRLGGNLSTGYWDNGDNPMNFGISFGLGLPTKGSRSNLNLGFEYGRTNFTNKDFTEEYYKISICATFNETWFFKRRFE